MDERREILQKWAEITVRIWLERIAKLGIIGSSPPQLLNSFQHTVTTQANGDMAKILFTYNWYGRMVDMGAGPGQREPKPWYSKTFIVEVRKLSEFLAKEYGFMGAALISDAIGGDATPE